MNNIADYANSEKYLKFLNFIYGLSFQLNPFQDLMQTSITITVRNWLQTYPEPVTKCTLVIPLQHHCHTSVTPALHHCYTTITITVPITITITIAGASSDGREERLLHERR
jgi:hypothetical protein